jgi:hypothetical protein
MPCDNDERATSSASAKLVVQGGASAFTGDPKISRDRDARDASLSESNCEIGGSGEATNRATVRRRSLHDPRKRAGIGGVVEQRLHGRAQREGQVVGPDEQLINSSDRRYLLDVGKSLGGLDHHGAGRTAIGLLSSQSRGTPDAPDRTPTALTGWWVEGGSNRALCLRRGLNLRDDHGRCPGIQRGAYGSEVTRCNPYDQFT